MAAFPKVTKPPAPLPGRSFAEVCPHLVSQWEPERNTLRPGEVSAGCSSVKIVWRCPRAQDHVWEAYPRDRARGSRCPACRGLVASSTNNLADHASGIAREWHPTRNEQLTPRDVVVNSRKIVWWQCQKVASHAWQARVNNRFAGATGCPDCAKYGRYKRVSAAHNLKALHPDIAAEWHEDANDPLRPEDVLPYSNDLMWWTCPVGHDYEMVVNARTGRGHNCPFCRNRRVDTSNSLAARRSDLAAEWDYKRNKGIKPDQVAWATNRSVHWRCPEADDHRWRAPVIRRTRSRTGCPFCAGQQVSVTNSLATRNPEAAKEWLAELNEGLRADQVVAGSTKPGRWQCPNCAHHVYTMPIRVRAVVGHTCPECSMASMSKPGFTDEVGAGRA